MDNTLDCLSWEPRILKHCPGYDDPYETQRVNHHPAPETLNRKRVTVYLYDTITGQTKKHDSFVLAAEAVKTDPANIRRAVIRKRLALKRYVCSV